MSNIKSIGITVSGLSPLETYSYSFSNQGGNWPVKVSPMSGTFQPASASVPYEIRSYVEFCPTTGLCPSGSANVFYNNPAVDNGPGAYVDRTNLYSVLGLAVNAASSNKQVVSAQTLVECNNCLPNISITAEENITLDIVSSNSKQIVTSVNGLIPNQSYSFVFTPVASNWPLKITPVSGILNSSSDSASIPSMVTMCSSSNDCTDALLFSPTYNCDNGQKPFAVVKLTVSPTNGGYQSAVSKDITVLCDDCINKIVLQAPSSIQLDKQSKNKINISAIAENLQVGQQYMYHINDIDANWPAVISPVSGQITAQASTMGIPFKLTFCPSTGLCPSDAVDVLDYSLDARCLMDYANIDKFTRFNLDISRIDCSGASDKVYSNDVTVNCVDCLPRPKAVLPNTVSLPANNNIYSFDAAIIDLIPGQKYEYEFKAVNSNWPTLVYPLTGIISSESTSTSIPTRLTFCRSTGLCETTSNVLPYTIDDTCIYGEGKERFTAVSLDIRPVDCDTITTSVSNTLLLRCENCLPTVQATLPTALSLSSASNRTPVTLSLNNLVIGKQYSYNVVGLEANWPVDIYPNSGSFVAISPNQTISLRAMFCPTPALCNNNNPSGILPYTFNASTYYGSNGSERLCRFRVDIESEDCLAENTVSSNDTLITCGNCLPTPALSRLSNNAILSVPGTYRYQLSTNAQNLIAGETYNYNVNYVDSNWPTIVSKQSGQFVAVADSKNIITDMQFCFPSGSCSQNTKDVMSYNLSPITTNTNRYTTINLSLSNSTSPNAPIVSDDFTLNCTNCLPNVNYTISFSGSPTLVLPTNCCSGNQIMRVNVGGAIPGDIHHYELSSSSSEVSFVPPTGTIVFKAGGAGTIISMMSTALSSGNSVIATCKLTNITSDVDAVDFLVIRCGSQVC